MNSTFPKTTENEHGGPPKVRKKDRAKKEDSEDEEDIRTNDDRKVRKKGRVKKIVKEDGEDEIDIRTNDDTGEEEEGEHTDSSDARVLIKKKDKKDQENVESDEDSDKKKEKEEDSDSSNSSEIPEGQYEVQCIHDRKPSKIGKGKAVGYDYLIEWDDFPKKEDWSWVPAASLHCEWLVSMYNMLQKPVRKKMNDEEWIENWIADKKSKQKQKKSSYAIVFTEKQEYSFREAAVRACKERQKELLAC
jgi:hypothetical protein